MKKQIIYFGVVVVFNFFNFLFSKRVYYSVEVHVHLIVTSPVSGEGDSGTV